MKGAKGMTKQKERQKNSTRRDYIAMAVVIALAGVMLLIFPGKLEPVAKAANNYLIELALVLPAVMLIIGLFSVWVPRELVVKYMGKTSGMRGIFLSMGLGMLPTGPLYIAFPIASALLKKEAKISNIIIFVSAWACIKLPQELVEIQFMGIKFTLIRLGLTILLVIVMGMIIEKLIELTDRKKIRT